MYIYHRLIDPPRLSQAVQEIIDNRINLSIIYEEIHQARYNRYGNIAVQESLEQRHLPAALVQ